jgi:hypothetical protein
LQRQCAPEIGRTQQRWTVKFGRLPFDYVLSIVIGGHTEVAARKAADVLAKEGGNHAE